MAFSSAQAAFLQLLKIGFRLCQFRHPIIISQSSLLYPLVWFIVLVSAGVSYLAEKKNVIKKDHVTS